MRDERGFSWFTFNLAELFVLSVVAVLALLHWF